jgi:hypothetical protein
MGFTSRAVSTVKWTCFGRAPAVPAQDAMPQWTSSS